MAKLVGSIRLDTSELDALARGLGTSTERALASIAFQVEGVTKANIITKDIIEFGALLGSITTTEIENGVWHVHDGVEYGVYHELGTHKIGARPFMTPAVETVSNQVADIVKRELFQ